jgi:hypothetical protein
MKDPLMKITNISKFAKFLVHNTIKDCGIEIQMKEIKNYINNTNVEGIVKQYAKRDSKNNLMVNNKIVQKIQNDLMDWILGVSLAKLAAKDELNCYWDNKRNCMVFSRNKEYK